MALDDALGSNDELEAPPCSVLERCPKRCKVELDAEPAAADEFRGTKALSGDSDDVDCSSWEPTILNGVAGTSRFMPDMHSMTNGPKQTKSFSPKCEHCYSTTHSCDERWMCDFNAMECKMQSQWIAINASKQKTRTYRRKRR